MFLPENLGMQIILYFPFKIYKTLEMQKIFLTFVIIVALISCNQKDIQQTTITIKTADSLFTKAKESYKTLDSIGKTINDSTKINSTVKEQIKKIEKEINLKSLNGKNLDSLSEALKKISKNVNSGNDIIEVIDSTNKELRDSKNPMDVLSTITKTIEKVTKQAKVQQAPQNQSNSENRNPAYTDPFSKTANIEIAVSDLPSSRATLGDILSNKGAEIFSESFSDINGAKRMEIGAKVPSNYFDDVIGKITRNIGNLNSNNITSNGKNYDANQMYNLNIALIEDSKHIAKDIPPASIPNETPKDTFGDKSANAFTKGIRGFGDVLVVLIPFWPILLIASLVWYFVVKNKKKRREEEFQRQLLLEKERQHDLQNQQKETVAEEAKNTPENSDEEIDYSKYMPKS